MTFSVFTGLNEAATALQKEANLPKCNTPPPIQSSSSHIYSPTTPKVVSSLYYFINFISIIYTV